MSFQLARPDGDVVWDLVDDPFWRYGEEFSVEDAAVDRREVAESVGGEVVSGGGAARSAKVFVDRAIEEPEEA